MTGQLLGTDPGPFIGLSLVLFGFFAFMSGQAVAHTWQRGVRMVPYAVLLGFGSRFLQYALFQGDLLSPTGFLLEVGWYLLVGLFAYRLTKRRKMVSQYPWLYERSGLLGWRERNAGKL
ncbi:MAG TPA: hypothetical protein VFO41_06535 [Alphaproteobacteria bacterium]|nr:hypothetical protein [Alphaproteobacteria bacterium]